MTRVTNGQRTARLSEAEARRLFADDVGPRVIGGLYRERGSEAPYRVLGIHYGPAALAALGWDAGWAITVQEKDEQAPRTHCTGWYDEEQQIVEAPNTADRVYKISYRSMTQEHYWTADAAHDHVVQELHDRHHGVAVVWAPGEDEPWDDADAPLDAHLLRANRPPEFTGYTVTSIPVAHRYDSREHA